MGRSNSEAKYFESGTNDCCCLLLSVVWSGKAKSNKVASCIPVIIILTLSDVFWGVDVITWVEEQTKFLVLTHLDTFLVGYEISCFKYAIHLQLQSWHGQRIALGILAFSDGSQRHLSNHNKQSRKKIQT